MTVPARISHRIPGRLRLRIPERRGDEEYFLDIAGELSLNEGIQRISTTAETASVLLEHELTEAEVDTLLAPLFELEGNGDTKTVAATPATTPGEGLQETWQALQRWCKEPNRLQSGTALLLIAHGLWRLRSGQTRGPDWFNAFWVAFNLLRMGK